MYLKHIILFSIVLLLSACQSIPDLSHNDDVPKSPAISDMQWQQSQQTVLAALREDNFDLATDFLMKMLPQANDLDPRWHYIRMALAVMPADYALPIIEQALQMPVVKKSPDYLFSFSRLLMQYKQPERALTVINQAIDIERNEALIFWRARLLAISQNFKEAKQDYQWLLSQSPEQSDYLSQYAALLMQTENYSEAESLLSQHGDVLHLKYQHILLLLQQDKYDQAQPLYDQLVSQISIDELSAKEQINYGELALWLKDYPTSLALLSKINDAEYVYQAKLLMGRVYLALDDSERALVLFKQVQNAPEDVAIPSFQMAAEVYMMQDSADNAIAILSEGLRFFQNQSDLLYSRALVFAQQANVTAAEEDLMKIIEQQPEHADALNALGYTWADNDMNLDQAYDYIKQAHLLKPDSKAILDSMGWVYFKRGDFIKAEYYLRAALNDKLTDEETLRHLIVVLEAQNKHEEARFFIDQLKQIQQDENAL